MTNDYKVVYSPEARNDLKAIYRYIAKEKLSPKNAKSQTQRIRAAIRSLNHFPTKFPIVEWKPWHSMEMHHLPIDNYIAFYLVDSKSLTVTIIRIFYCGRNIQEIISNQY
jgi:toxin ParE1/3/4